MRSTTGWAVSGALALALVAAAPWGQSPAPTLARDVQPLFDARCTRCHGSEEHKARLDLSAGKSYASVVNVPSVQVDTLLRVKPGDPENSYLMQKVLHTAAMGKGMPRGFFGSSHLSPQEIETIRAWIAAGAKP